MVKKRTTKLERSIGNGPQRGKLQPKGTSAKAQAKRLAIAVAVVQRRKHKDDVI